jgi:hypothetical protein
MNASQAVIDYQSGLSIKKIGELHGVDPTSVYYYLKKAGVERGRRVRKFSVVDDLFSQQSEAGLYWLGFCAADGHVCEDKNQVQVQLAKTDRDQLERFRAALQTDKPIYDYWNRKFPKSCLHVTSEQLSKDLMAFGVATLLKTPIDLRHHLVRGLFDGDGSISCHDYVYGNAKSYHRSVRLMGHEPLLRAVQSLVAHKAETGLGHLHFVRGIYEWALGGADNVMRFRDWLYKDATIFMPRKREGFCLLDRESAHRRARNY